jgi:hypothetical protein
MAYHAKVCGGGQLHERDATATKNTTRPYGHENATRDAVSFSGAGGTRV